MQSLCSPLLERRKPHRSAHDKSEELHNTGRAMNDRIQKHEEQDSSTQEEKDGFQCSLERFPQWTKRHWQPTAQGQTAGGLEKQPHSRVTQYSRCSGNEFVAVHATSFPSL